uniref:XK-related protein n=1 Tax=Ditylenchus dipsaci TaxID=166011 RepID=A0A915D0N5_9BILA
MDNSTFNSSQTMEIPEGCINSFEAYEEYKFSDLLFAMWLASSLIEYFDKISICSPVVRFSIFVGANVLSWMIFILLSFLNCIYYRNEKKEI